MAERNKKTSPIKTSVANQPRLASHNPLKLGTHHFILKKDGIQKNPNLQGADVPKAAKFVHQSSQQLIAKPVSISASSQYFNQFDA